MAHFAVLDIEATGGSPRKDRIIEIAIYRHDGQKIIDSFESLIKPEIAIPPFIAGLTGITNDMVAESPAFYEVAKRIVEITEDCVLVAHNARFDFDYLRNEFKRFGYEYRRKRLCTLKLSKFLCPGLSSYSLPEICKYFDIEVKHRHRAFGDALATVSLFENLQAIDKDDAADHFINQKLKEEDLPPNLKKEDVENLPEETGIYFMHDESDRIMYVGKSVEIKRRIYQHITGKLRSDKQSKMVKNIHRIAYEITGSDLLASIKEDYLIKELRPRYNKAQKSKGFFYGVYQNIDAQGYKRLKVHKLGLKGQEPLEKFEKKSGAETSIRRLIKRHKLCDKLCGLERATAACFKYVLKDCHGACIGKETPEEYNARLDTALSVYNYPFSNFVIVDEGRSLEESTLIYIKDGCFRGYCYFDNKKQASWSDRLSRLIDYPENPSLDRFIRQYLKKNDLELIELETET